MTEVETWRDIPGFEGAYQVSSLGRARSLPGGKRLGRVSENNRDVVRHGRHNNASKTHCPHGHEYTNENTAVRRRGVSVSGEPKFVRVCRTCATQRASAA